MVSAILVARDRARLGTTPGFNSSRQQELPDAEGGDVNRVRRRLRIAGIRPSHHAKLCPTCVKTWARRLRREGYARQEVSS